MFKINNKATRTTSMSLHCCLLTYFTPCSSVYFFDFEQINVCGGHTFSQRFIFSQISLIVSKILPLNDHLDNVFFQIVSVAAEFKALFDVHRSSPSKMFFKMGVLKVLQISQENIRVGVSF